MDQQSQVYTYEELKSDQHIRLLNLSPGHKGDPLRCSIIQIELENIQVEYYAISYVWGAPVFSQTLQVRDETDQGNFQKVSITLSLDAALRDLRDATKARLLWADGVCINQSDLAEKARQIPLMTTIYSKASSVLAYTGPEADNSNLALDLISQLQPYARGETAYTGSREFVKEWPRLPPFTDDSWTALRRLWKRPWSGRAWIGQEFSLNKDVLLFFGARSVSWIEVFLVLANAGKSLPREIVGDNAIDPDPEQDDPHSSAQNYAGALLGMLYLRSRILMRSLEVSDEGISGSLGLQDILQSCHHLSSTDPRDMIYAFMGISEDVTSLDITIDYDKNTNPVQKLYCEVAAALLRRYGTLSLLSSVYSKNPHNLPSWVPDWSTFPDANRRLYKIPFYNASAGSRAHISISEDDKMLTLRGAILDEITHITEPIGTAMRADFASAGANGGQSHLWLQEQIRRMQALPSYPTGQSRISVLSKTLVGNSTQGGQESPDHVCELGFQAVASQIAIMYALVKGYFAEQEVEGNKKMVVDMEAAAADPALGELAYSLDWDFEERGVAPPYIELVWISAAQRCLGYTASGLVGLVPPHAEVGDVVVIFAGAKVPFVIRAVTHDDGEGNNGLCYRLVGESYVHGFMKGEVVRRDDQSFWGDIVLM
ncbi:Heterokaryon incompatibility protein (HET) domain containing protein [Rhypophila decipiens]